MKLIRHFLLCVTALMATAPAVDSSSLRLRSDEAIPKSLRGPGGESDDSVDDVLPALALELKAVEVGLAVEVDTDHALDNDVSDDDSENPNDFDLLSYDRRLRGSTEEKAATAKTPKTTAKPKPATTTKTPATPKSTKPARTHVPSTSPTPAPTIVDPESTDAATLTPTVWLQFPFKFDYSMSHLPIDPGMNRSDLPTQHHSSGFWSAPKSVPRLAVLLLNASFDSWQVVEDGVGLTGPELFWNMWSSASLTVCADGGANRLYDRSVILQVQDRVAPKFIKGDLDSLRPDVRAFFTDKGTKVLHDPSQLTNDLDKCLQLIYQEQEQQSDEKFSVLIFGAMGGRFDQEMQNINALFRWKDKFQELVLLSDETTVRLLEPEVRHVISPNFHFETRTCGLIPITGTCKGVATSGLKWNLSPGMATGFGGLISSSNHVDDACEQVEVVTPHPLIWTTELKK